MIRPPGKSPEPSFARLAVWPAAVLFTTVCLSACSEPPEKPIPPLDLSKAPEQEPADSPEEPTGPATPGTLTRMPLGNLYQLVQKNAAVIYDVRPGMFYKMGHVPGAISFPESDFDRDIARHEPRIRTANANNTPVVIYCTDLACPDALNVATRISARGHDVSVLQGGYEAWKIAAP